MTLLCRPSGELWRSDFILVSLQRPSQLKAGEKSWFISVLMKVGTECICWWTSVQEGRQGCQGHQEWSPAAAHLNIHPGNGGLGKGGEITAPLQQLQMTSLLLTWTKMHRLLLLAGYGQVVHIWGWNLSWFKDRHWLHFLSRKTPARSQK